MRASCTVRLLVPATIALMLEEKVEPESLPALDFRHRSERRQRFELEPGEASGSAPTPAWPRAPPPPGSRGRAPRGRGVGEANSQTNWSAWEVWVTMSASHAPAYAMRTRRWSAAGIRRRDIWLGTLIGSERSNIQSRQRASAPSGAGSTAAPEAWKLLLASMRLRERRLQEAVRTDLREPWDRCGAPAGPHANRPAAWQSRDQGRARAGSRYRRSHERSDSSDKLSSSCDTVRAAAARVSRSVSPDRRSRRGARISATPSITVSWLLTRSWSMTPHLAISAFRRSAAVAMHRPDQEALQPDEEGDERDPARPGSGPSERSADRQKNADSGQEELEVLGEICPKPAGDGGASFTDVPRPAGWYAANRTDATACQGVLQVSGSEPCPRPVPR